jgi:hypothetical protein
VPSDDRFGLDNGQGRTPVWPEAGKQDPEDAVARTQLRSFHRLLEHGHLLTQDKVLHGGRSAAHDECPEKEKDGLEDAHSLSLPWLRNGPSYWMHQDEQTAGRIVSSDSPQNPQVRIFK